MRRGLGHVAAQTGISAWTVVPDPGLDRTVSRPPRVSTRSWSPRRPEPPVSEVAPRPSSRTLTRRCGPAGAPTVSTVTVTSEAWACLAALVSASATM